MEAVSTVLNAMQNAVAKAKETRGDAMPGLREVLRLLAPATLQPAGYVVRGDETKWLNELRSANALLLSGPPRCGKTDAGRYIAAQFQRLGYEVGVGVDVQEARRFLSQLGARQRLFLLDDPLGGTRVESDASRSMSDLRRTIQLLSATRKLIVCQNQFQLFSVLSASSLVQCAFAKHKWFDLAVVSEQFLSKVWSQFSEQANLPTSIKQAVVRLIKEPSTQLEVGALAHLASSAEMMDKAATDGQLLRKAREGASDLGRELADTNPEMRDVLLGLAAGSGPLQPIRQMELAFALSQGGELPGKRDLASYTVFGGFDEQIAFPKYVSPPSLTAGQHHAVDVLERARFIRRSSSGMMFAHPFYRAAAQSLINSPTALTATRVLAIARRQMFSLSRDSSASAARSLEWLFDSLADEEFRSGVSELAVEGLYSIFPATCDLCLSFLLRRKVELTAERVRDLPEWIDTVLSIDLGRIRWHEGEAWIPDGALSFMESMSNEYALPEDLRGFVAKLGDDAQPIPPAKESAKVLNGLKANPQLLTMAAAVRILGYDESLLRSVLARVWLSVNREKDEPVLERLFEDAHPRVLLGIYKGLLRGWSDYSPERQTSLLNRLTEVASDPYLAPTLLPRLAVFDRVEYSGFDPPWEVFAALLPVVLRSLPRLARFNDARLFSAAETATNRLPPEQIVVIVKSWIEWLRREAQWRLPGDYELAVADILLRGTKMAPSARQGVIDDLLTFPQTGPLICFIKDLVDEWTALTQREKSAVLSKLTEPRPDTYWLRAVAITRLNVPEEVQSAITGETNFLEKSPEQIVSGLSAELLRSAVCTFVGNPPELWWIGTQGSRSKAFTGVVDYLLTQPDHSLFQVALWNALISPDDERINGIIRNAGPTHAETLFAYLLAYKVNCTGNFLPKSWGQLLSQMTKIGRRDFALDQMARCAPAILDELADVQEWLQNEVDMRDLLWRLSGDVFAIDLASEIAEARNRGKQTNDLISDLRELLRDHVPVLHGTYSLLQRTLSGQHTGNDIERQLASLRDEVFAIRDRLQRELPEPDQKIEDWIRHDSG